MHCVLVLNAGYFAANSPKVGANGGSLEYKFILPHSHADPFLYQNEPSRESIFCDKVSTWWIKRALMRLNILLKTGQKNAYAAYQHVSNGTETTYTYYRQREQLPGMLLTANGHSTMETQK